MATFSSSEQNILFHNGISLLHLIVAFFLSHCCYQSLHIMRLLRIFIEIYIFLLLHYFLLHFFDFFRFHRLRVSFIISIMHFFFFFWYFDISMSYFHFLCHCFQPHASCHLLQNFSSSYCIFSDGLPSRLLPSSNFFIEMPQRCHLLSSRLFFFFRDAFFIDFADMRDDADMIA